MELPSGWLSCLEDETKQDYYRELERYVSRQRETHTVFPAEDAVFKALELTPWEETNVVILGQDPYHDIGQAHGLCFSVLPGTPLPPSLRNIFKELGDDQGIAFPRHGCLASWARQGVLLLNTVLTVRAHEANSHRGQGWERFTDAIIQSLNECFRPIVFVLWGIPARHKRSMIDPVRHEVLESPHPSPLSAHRGFFGSRPFSKINNALRHFGNPEINWELSDTADDWRSSGVRDA